MRSALHLDATLGNDATRQILSHRAADAAAEAARTLLASHHTPSSVKPIVKKLPSGQPVLKSAIRGCQVHISISHLQKTVAGFAASGSF